MSNVIIKDNDQPLITFFLLTYNQEQFISEALQGAFSQSYFPLEIILSDDCSTDGTYEIMEKMVSNYCGNHKIILKRNDRNLGVVVHLNRIMEIAKGELIVAAAGDDISEPQRTSIIKNYYLSYGKLPCSFYSAVNKIDQNGNIKEYYSAEKSIEYFSPVSFAKARFYGVAGCSHAWHRSIFDKFGPLSPNIIYEDAVIPFRASLLGGKVIHIPQALVKYRTSNESVMRNDLKGLDRILLHEKRLLSVFDNNLKDLMYYCTFINNDFTLKEDCLKEIIKQRNISKYTISIFEKPFENNIFHLASLLSKESFYAIYQTFKLLLRDSINRYKGF